AGRSDACGSATTRLFCREGLRPVTRRRLGALEVGPIRAHRSEDVQHGCALGARDRLVRNMARDHIAVAGVQNALVVPDPEFDRALDHKTQLFVLVVVIGRLGVGLEVDERHSDAFPVHRARGEPLGEEDPLHVAKRPERLHSTTRSMIVAVPSPPPQHMVSRPYRRSRRSSSYRSRFMRMAPDAPSGCPTAMAPPLTFVLSMSAPVSFCQARTTDAKASLTSKRSM